MTSDGSVQVWDLHDETQGVTVFEDRGHELDFAGPIAALLGAVSVGAALSAGLPVLFRWVLVVGLGVAAFVVAVAGLRRPQTVLTLGLAAVGLLAPVAAAVVLSSTPLTASTVVRNTSMPATTTGATSTTLTRTAAFEALPATDRRAAGTFASGLVLRLRTLHGDYGPFPEKLALSGGGVVEAAGDLRGTPLGPLPDGMRLTYSVTADRTAFRVVVNDVDVATATVRADSTLAVPGLD